MASAVYRSTSTEKLEWSWSSWNDSVCSLEYVVCLEDPPRSLGVDPSAVHAVLSHRIPQRIARGTCGRGALAPSFIKDKGRTMRAAASTGVLPGNLPAIARTQDLAGPWIDRPVLGIVTSVSASDLKWPRHHGDAQRARAELRDICRWCVTPICATDTRSLTAGVDVALVRISALNRSDVSIKLGHYSEHPVPSSLRSRILALCKTDAPTTLEEVCDLNFELGDVFATAALESGVDMSKVDLIASHGQTLWHHPVACGKGGYASGERRAATLQMGESAVIAQRTGV